MKRKPLGNVGEKLAANYLIAQGYRIIETNYYNPKGYRWGEIDIIAEDSDKMLVFVEVKCRKGKKDEVVPEENLTNLKVEKIIKTAQIYLRAHDLLELPWRIDLVAIVFDFNTRRSQLHHIKCIHK